MGIKIENTQVFGWEGAIRGARNPMNSWEKSDSWFYDGYYGSGDEFKNINNEFVDSSELSNKGLHLEYTYDLPSIGPSDHKLLMNLCKGGTEEAKWRRMVHVQMDVTAPFYWWKEFETYKVGTVSNSCSTMHKIQAKEFTLDDFSCEHLLSREDDNSLWAINIDGEYCYYSPNGQLDHICQMMNAYRSKFLETKDKKYWWQMIQLLPTSYNQKRTIDLNYEVLASQYRQRKDHKLDEWHQYCDWIKTLPYSEFITMEEDYGIKIPTLTREDVELLRPKYEDFRKSVIDGIIPVNKEVSDWMNKMDAIIEEYDKITTEET